MLCLVVNTNVVPAPDNVQYRREVRDKETGRFVTLYCWQTFSSLFFCGGKKWVGEGIWWVFSFSFSPSKGTRSVFQVARGCVCVLGRYMYVCLNMKSGEAVPGAGEHSSGT